MKGTGSLAPKKHQLLSAFGWLMDNLKSRQRVSFFTRHLDISKRTSSRPVLNKTSGAASSEYFYFVCQTLGTCFLADAGLRSDPGTLSPSVSDTHTQIVAVEGLILVFEMQSKCFPEGAGLDLDQETLRPLVSAAECWPGSSQLSCAQSPTWAV